MTCLRWFVHWRTMTREEKYMMRAWEQVAMHVTALLASAPGDRIIVICNDGFRLQLGFDPLDVRTLKTIETFSVRVQSDGLRYRWKYARNPARGRFLGVKVEDVIELIWHHCGVELERSREATRLLKPAEG